MFNTSIASAIIAVSALACTIAVNYRAVQQPVSSVVPPTGGTVSLRPGGLIPSFVAESNLADKIVFFPDRKPTLLYVYKRQCQACDLNSKSVAHIGRELCRQYRCIAISLDRHERTDYRGLQSINYETLFFPSYEFMRALDISTPPVLLYVSEDGRLRNIWRGVIDSSHNREDVQSTLGIKLSSGPVPLS
jgi:hypothetical protein